MRRRMGRACRRRGTVADVYVECGLPVMSPEVETLWRLAEALPEREDPYIAPFPGARRVFRRPGRPIGIEFGAAE